MMLTDIEIIHHPPRNHTRGYYTATWRSWFGFGRIRRAWSDTGIIWRDIGTGRGISVAAQLRLQAEVERRKFEARSSPSAVSSGLGGNERREARYMVTIVSQQEDQNAQG